MRTPIEKARAKLARRFAPLHAPIPMIWDDAERLCRRCKQPTHWRTLRGAAIHPSCERGVAQLTDDAYRRVVFDVALALGGTVKQAPPATNDPAPIVLRQGPCDWCGADGFGIEGTGGADRDSVRPWQSDKLFHCTKHLFYPYVWPTEEETP